MEIKKKVMYGLAFTTALAYLLFPRIAYGQEKGNINTQTNISSAQESKTQGTTTEKGGYTEINFEQGGNLEAITITTLEGFLKQQDKDIRLWVIKAFGGVYEIDKNELLVFPILINQYNKEKDKDIRNAILNSLDALLEDNYKNQPIKGMGSEIKEKVNQQKVNK